MIVAVSELARTCLKWPYKGCSLCDQRPRGTEGQKADSFVTRASPKEVADKVVATIVDHANDRDGRQQGKCVLRDPFPEENGSELTITNSSMPC